MINILECFIGEHPSVLALSDKVFPNEVLSAMAWAKPEFGKGEIDRAGEFLAIESDAENGNVIDWDWLVKYQNAVTIVSNWRSVHSYPLQTMKMLLKNRAKNIYPNAIVAQRLKRLASIKLKLKLSKEMGRHPNLSQMQDIGGCRAIMENVSQVRRLEKKFDEGSKKNPHRGPEHFKTFDYLAAPKASGYRGIHLVYRFRSSSAEHRCYNGQRIEIQIRTKIQHSWATAVETYSTFSGEALKSNVGSDEWKRFFALASSVFAIEERQPTVPGTPATLEEIVPELETLYTSLNVRNTLSGWTAATQFATSATDDDIKNAAMILLELNPDKFELTLTPFSKDQLPEANKRYAKIEKDRPDLQAVLVSVDSMHALRLAYPNYFLDTNVFLDGLDKEILESKTKP
jgi:ppGpp synthetase/RelA/SpoT-type nucleotidyltranferase